MGRSIGPSSAGTGSDLLGGGVGRVDARLAAAWRGSGEDVVQPADDMVAEVGAGADVPAGPGAFEHLDEDVGEELAIGDGRADEGLTMMRELVALVERELGPVADATIEIRLALSDALNLAGRAEDCWFFCSSRG